MNEQYEITEAELEIMQVLWKNKRGNLTTIMEELGKKNKNEERNKKRGISWHKTWNVFFLRLISQNIEKNLVIFPIYRYIKLKYNELRKNAKIIYFREERGNAAKDSI